MASDSHTGESHQVGTASAATQGPLVGPQWSGHVWDRADLDSAELLKRLAMLVKAVPDTMFRLAGDGTFLDAKPGAQDEFAWEPGNFLGRNVADVLPADLAERTGVALKAAGEDGVATFQYRLDADEGPRWYEARVVAVDDEFVVSVRDITQTQEAETDLTTFLELSPDLAAIADLQGHFVRLNARWSTVLGWSEDVLLSRPYLSFVHPDDVEPTTRAAARLSEGRNVVGFENRYRTRAGGHRWLEWRCQPIVERDIIVCIARDVTDVRAARERQQVMAEIATALAMSTTSPAELAQAITRIVETAVPSHCSVALVTEPASGIPQQPEVESHRVALPVLTDEAPTAVLTVSRTPDQPGFTEEELALLDEVATQIAPLIERAKLYQGLVQAAELLAATDTGIAKVTLDAGIISWNPAAERITGWTAEDMVGRNLADLTSAEFLQRAKREAARVLATGQTTRFESERHRPDGTPFWVEISMAPIHDWTGATVAIAVAFTDITEQRRAKAQLEVLARTDSLTGTANRAEMERVLSDRLTLGRAGALLFIDLDGFKEVNDVYGHGIGDQVLREAGARLRACARASDVIGRFGGDEFGLLMDYGSDPAPDTDVRVAGRILSLLADPFRVSGHLIELAGSCGIAHFPDDATDLDTLLQRADAAMYAAKQGGGGHAQRFRPGLEQHLRDLSAERAEIRKGMQNREFDVVYQPIFALQDRRVVAVEALARWQRDGQTLLPRSFLPAAEDSGLIIPLGYQLIELTCDEFVTRASRCLPARACGLWINLSRRQFSSEDLPTRLARILQRRALDPSLVTVEITETTLFDDPRQASATLASLKELGVLIALDDFGTGYSSLGALHDLPVDAIKIDQVFVQRLKSADGHSNHGDRALVEAIIRMGHALGLVVVAEGVEDPTQVQVLTELGCDLAQGLLLAPPADVETAFAEITPD